MNDDDFLSCLGYNLTDSCTPCPSDSGIDLSSMELDLWPLNCGTTWTNLPNCRVEGNSLKGDLDDAKSIQLESEEMYSDSSVNQCNHYTNGTDVRHNYINSDRSYFTHYQSNSNGKVSSMHYSASSSSPPPLPPPPPLPSLPPSSLSSSTPLPPPPHLSSLQTCSPRSSTPLNTSYHPHHHHHHHHHHSHPHQSSTSFLPSTASQQCSSILPATSLNSISYSFHPTLQMNQTLCTPHQSSQSQPSLQSNNTRNDNYFNQNSNPGHISMPQQGIFPTAMSVNLSMNMTMGFASSSPSSAPSSDQCQQSTVAWPPSTANSQSSLNYGVDCSPSQTPDSPSQMSSIIANQVNQVTANYFDTTYSPTFSSSPLYTYQGSYSEHQECLSIHGPPPTATTPSLLIEKEYSELRQSARSSSSPLSERSPNEINVRYNYHNKGKLAQDTLSHESDDNTDCINGTSGCNNTSNGNNLPPNLCRICNKTYARPSTLKTHLRTHSGERPYRCPTCNKSFSQAANLTAHIRTHSGEKPFGCPVCNRKFSQSSSVTTHMRTHSGERPYRCCICKKAFSDSSTLTKHLRIHSGEKPYQCKLCLLRFSQSGNLNRHMRIHANIN